MMRIRNLAAFLVITVLPSPFIGAITTEQGPERTVSAEDYDQWKPAVAYNSIHQEYLIVWHDTSPIFPRTIMGQRVDLDGNKIAQFTIAFEDSPPRDNARASVAYDPDDDVYLVAWSRDYFGDGSDWDIYGRIIPWDGPTETLTQFSITGALRKQWHPRIAYGSAEGEFMVTWWTEGSDGVHSFCSAQRVAPNGTLNGSTITLPFSSVEERVGPDIAYNQARNEYLIVYQRMDDTGGNIYGIRLTGTGSVIGGDHFGIAAWPDPETAPRVAASSVSDDWAIVWQSDVSGFMKDVYARRMWVDGTGANQFSAPVLVDQTALDERNPDIAAYPENTEYLITWESQYSNSSGPFGIFARTLNTSDSLGNVFNPRPVYTGQSWNYMSPTVAASPAGWMVAWEHDRNDTPTYQDIHARAVYGPLFSDGFETGNFGRWDSHSP